LYKDLGWEEKYYVDYFNTLKDRGEESDAMSFNEYSWKLDKKDLDGSAKDIKNEYIETIDSNKQIADADAAFQEKLNTLYGEAETSGKSFLEGIKGEREKRYSDLASLLSGMSDRAFDENNPAILEDLSARGLLHSSAVGDSLAKERARIQQTTQDTLRMQALSDLDYEQNLAKSLEERLYGLKTTGLDAFKGYNDAGLQRAFSLTDFYAQGRQAKQLAQMQAEAMQESAKTQMYGSLLGMGAGALISGGTSLIPQGIGTIVNAFQSNKKNVPISSYNVG
jgi:hypothetical protein